MNLEVAEVDDLELGEVKSEGGAVRLEDIRGRPDRVGSSLRALGEGRTPCPGGGG